MLLEKYEDGSMEVLLAFSGQKINNGTVVMEEPLVAMHELFTREENPVRLLQTELGHPNRSFINDSVINSDIELGSFAYTINGDNVCGWISEVYLKRLKNNRLILTGIWTPTGNQSATAIQLIDEYGVVKLGGRIVSVGNTVTKIITWDLMNPKHQSITSLAELETEECPDMSYWIKMSEEELKNNPTAYELTIEYKENNVKD